MSDHYYLELRNAIWLAFDAHKGQTRSDGSDFIFHPLEVMIKCKSNKAKVVAVLHDIVEDTDISYRDIEWFFGKEIRELVDLLTLKPNQKYEDYIKELSKNEIAKEVKLADLHHNFDTLYLITDKERRHRLEDKYLSAFDILDTDTTI